MQSLIALKKLNSLVLDDSRMGRFDNDQLTLTFNANLMNLGYTLSRDAMDLLRCHYSEEEIIDIADDTINNIKNMLGADVKYDPMYPNFPKQVMDANIIELYYNAIVHYLTGGTPNYDKLPRDFSLEGVKLKAIGVASQDDFDSVFGKILQSKDSISEEDKRFVEWFADNTNLQFPNDVPFKENMCMVAGMLIEKGQDISHLVKTTTDVLRVATYLSDGDVSLADNTKFKSLSRSTRRVLLNALDKCINEEDVRRHSSKWVKLFHNLHVGDFKCVNVNRVAKKLRDGQKLETFNAKVEELIANNSPYEAANLLVTRPGEFARRIGHLLSLTGGDKKIIEKFATVAEKVPTKNLLQMNSAIQVRSKDITKRVVFPKGSTQKAVVVREPLSKLSATTLDLLGFVVSEVLTDRFSKLETLGKVYVDPALAKCPLPAQQRSASTSTFNVARGTRLPIEGTDNTLRFFIYWKGDDIDLSATLHDEKFKMIEQVSYTNLRSRGYESCHSGDITSAPRGASEFIDITMDKALACGARYVAMNVFVFRGPNFGDHEVCYAGWMTRKKPNSNEIYDPKTVKLKADLTSNGKQVTPVIFDLKTREAIWVDLAGQGRSSFFGRNVHSNKASIEETIEALTSLDNKPSLYELFLLHGNARGQLVDNPEEADTVFSFDGDVTPYDITTINSDYLS